MKDEFELATLTDRGDWVRRVSGLVRGGEGRRKVFLSKMANRLSRKAGDLYNWIQRGFPRDEQFNCEVLWQAAEDTINEFLTDVDFPNTDREVLRKTWAGLCEHFYGNLCATFLKWEDVCEKPTNYIFDYLKSMEEEAVMLPPVFAYKLLKNIDGYCTVTPEDFTFLAALLPSQDEDRRKLCEKVSTAEMKSSHEIVGSLMSEDGKQWAEIRNNDYAHNFKNGKNPSSASWELFEEKARALPWDKLFRLFPLLLLIGPHNGMLPTFEAEEIDQLLAFKYCLTENGQRNVLDWIKSKK